MRRRGVRGTCQLLFARHDGDTVILDLIALDPLTIEGDGLPAGAPFVLGIRARRPDWATANVVDALTRAALLDSIVDVELIDAANSPTAVLRTGEHELVLEIDLSVHG
jgi:hypothetical protein